MHSANGRIRKIQEQLPPAPEEDAYTIQAFAADVIAAIDAGWLVDYPEHQRDMFLSPTVADELTPDERSQAHYLLSEAQKDVALVAEQTGWRSPLAKNSYREWEKWRANSCDELRFVMELIVNAT